MVILFIVGALAIRLAREASDGMLQNGTGIFAIGGIAILTSVFLLGGAVGVLGGILLFAAGILAEFRLYTPKAKKV